MIRTCDTRIRNPVLYPLSYEGNVVCRRTFYTNSYLCASYTLWPLKSTVHTAVCLFLFLTP